MEVILLEKIHKLGELGDSVQVKPGYGRNYLIPHGKAVQATPENIIAFETRREELEKAQKEALGLAQSRAETLAGVSIRIARKAGTEGKLYGSVGTADIAEAVTATGVELSKHEVRLPDGPFRMLGEYQVGIQLITDVQVQIALQIVAEEG
ncbi:MAG: 50S ribosomal protein L9 [Gammaproteobacteria bacterium]